MACGSDGNRRHARLPIGRRTFVALCGVAAIGTLTGCVASHNDGATGNPIRVFEDDLVSEGVEHAASSGTVRIAFASVVSPEETMSRFNDLVKYLEDQTGWTIETIRRETYEEVNDMLASGEVDFAFICSLSYVLGKDADFLEGMAVPIVHGSRMYRSYFICNSQSSIALITDLKGKSFAFTDPYSYTGRLAALDLVRTKFQSDATYFGEVYYTYSHDSSVRAVHLGLADAAAVDSIVFDEIAARQPDLVANIQVLYQGPQAGMPPVVASVQVPTEQRALFQKALFDMRDNARGATILDNLGYDSFGPLQDEDYDVVRHAADAVDDVA